MLPTVSKGHFYYKVLKLISQEISVDGLTLLLCGGEDSAADERAWAPSAGCRQIHVAVFNNNSVFSTKEKEEERIKTEVGSVKR